jgi:hypothetical protein
MGNKYVSFSVRRPDQQRVADVLKRAKRVAIVTPPQNDYVVAYDKEADNFITSEIHKVGILLSKEADALVFAVLNYDDDVLAYWLFEQGQLADSFDSNPDFDKEVPTPSKTQGGDAHRLCDAFRATTTPAEVEAILRGDYVFAVEQYQRLADLLGLPSWSVGFGYDYVADGDLEEELDDQQLIRIG